MGELDFDSIPYPKEKLFFNLIEDKDHISSILAKIQELHEPKEENVVPSHPTWGCFGAAANNAIKLLNKDGGRVI